MQATWRFFTAFNIPVKIHWSFSLIFVWIFFVGWFNEFELAKVLWLSLIFIALFICVILHEFGHALMAKFYGVQTRDIILSPIGGLARLEKLPKNPIQELFIALAGPLVNFGIAMLLFIVLIALNKQELALEKSFFTNLGIGKFNFIKLIFDMNLALGVLNLIPAFPMDGGRIFRALLSLKLSSETATKYSAILGQLLAIIAIILGFTIFKNPVLPIVGAFIFFLANQEYRNFKFLKKLDETPLAKILRPNYTKLYLTDTIEEVLQKKGEHENSFLIFNKEESLQGVLHATFLKDAIKSKNEDDFVEKYLSPNFEYLSVDRNVKDLYFTLQKNGYSILPVIEHGEIIGVIDRTALVDLIKGRE